MVLPSTDMKPFIQITRHLYEEPYTLNLVIIASNGTAMGSLEFYLNPDNLREIGENLSEFPKFERSNYLFERGRERPEDNHAWYFRFRAYAKNNLEECGIHLRLNNNAKHNLYKGRPGEFTSFETPQLTDFTIDIDAQGIRKLGELIREFSKLNHQRLYWRNETGSLDNNVLEPPTNHGHVVTEAFAALPK